MAEPQHYSTGEIARSAWIIAKAAATVARGGSPEKYNAQVERLQQAAVEREEAEAAARAKAEAERLAAKAKHRAASWI